MWKRPVLNKRNMISVRCGWTTSDDRSVKSKSWKSGVWRSEAPGLWAPKFLQTSWREQSTMHVRKPFDMGGSWITILLLLFDECCMNLCSVCAVWIFGSKEGASGLTLDQASAMCCRPSPCNVEYYKSIYTFVYIQHTIHLDRIQRIYTA